MASPRLPIPGQDAGNWGDILNEYLSVSHNERGQLKKDAVKAPQLSASSVSGVALANSSVSTTKLADGSITEDKLALNLRERIETLESVTSGRSIEIRATTTHVQWKYVDELVWTNLVALDSLRGLQGDKGNKGDKGDAGTTTWLGITDKPTSFPTTASSITDASVVSREVLTATNAAAIRTVIGAGTSSLEIGTTETTVAAGDHSHVMTDLTAGSTDTSKVLAPNGDGGVAWVDTPSGSGGGSDPWAHYVVSADYTATSLTLSDVPGLSIPAGLTAGVYQVRCMVLSKATGGVTVI